jgi:zinc/manganese transport system permease protein
MFDIFLQPFAEFVFMRRALAGVLALSVSSAPLGVLLMLRRMSLTGDGMSHAILPGAALAYAFFGLSVWALTVGGFIAGLTVAFGAGALARFTALKEDATLASFYLLSLALGVLIVASRGGNVDLMHFLFGSILALDEPTLLLVAAISSLTLLLLAAFWRPLVLDGLDPGFLRTVSRAGGPTYAIFLVLLVMNLVAGFHALGTLLAVAFLVLPAVASRFWSRDLTRMTLLSCLFAMSAGASGLLASYHLDAPTGPAVVLSLGVIFAVSAVVGPIDGLARQVAPKRHRAG